MYNDDRAVFLICVYIGSDSMCLLVDVGGSDESDMEIDPGSFSPAATAVGSHLRYSPDMDDLMMYIHGKILCCCVTGYVYSDCFYLIWLIIAPLFSCCFLLSPTNSPSTQPS
jgi:hypothetical protein